MTTLGPINSQNRVANYSANYRASLFLSPLSVECPCYTPGPPIIVAVGRLFVTAPDRWQDPAERFFFPPLPPHIPGILSRAFDRIRYRWNAEFAKTSIENTPDRGAPCRCTRFRAACRNCLVRDRTTYTQPIGTRSKTRGRPDLQSIRSRNGREFEKRKCRLYTRTVVFPLLVFPLSLSVFSPFHFHFDKQELDDKAEAYIKTRNGTVRIDDIRAMGRRLIFTTLFPLYDSYGYFT